MKPYFTCLPAILHLPHLKSDFLGRVVWRGRKNIDTITVPWVFSWLYKTHTLYPWIFSQTYCFLKVLIFSWRVRSHKHFHSVVLYDCLLLFSHSIQSDSLWPHGLQHVRLPSTTLSPRVCSNSCPLSQWYCPTTSSSIAPLSSCPQTFPASGSFPVSWLFASGGQRTEASALVSVLPMNM